MPTGPPHVCLQGEALRQSLLVRYLGRQPSTKRGGSSGPEAAPGVFPPRPHSPLMEVQCQLDREGASDLVVDLIMMSPNLSIFLESVELGIALLRGGNPVIQVRARQRVFSFCGDRCYGDFLAEFVTSALCQAEHTIPRALACALPRDDRKNPNTGRFFMRCVGVGTRGARPPTMTRCAGRCRDFAWADTGTE